MILLLKSYICDNLYALFMKQFSAVICLVICVTISSCVPYKDTVYLQNKAAATDSTMQIIEMQKPYRIQINDILNKLENKDTDLAGSINDYKRLIQLNNHIDKLFKKKVKEISSITNEIKKDD